MRMCIARSGPSNVELSPRFEQIECRADLRCARGRSGRLVIAVPDPTPKPLAPDRPGFPVSIDQDIGEGGAAGGMKQLFTQPDVDEHFAYR
jgi:hypothetical protein